MVIVGNSRPKASPYASPSASPAATLGVVAALGATFWLLWILIALVPAVIAAAPNFAASILRSAGLSANPATMVMIGFGALVVVAALFAFDFSRLLKPENPVRRAWAIWDTARRTALDSLCKPIMWFCLIEFVCFLALIAIFARAEIARAAEARSLAALDSPTVSRIVAGSVAFSALCVGLKSLSDYLVGGRRFLTKALAKQTPTDPEVLKQTSIENLRFYHLVLRFAGAFSFVCECVFQVVVFGLITWGVDKALPGVALFSNPSAISPANAIGFWADRVFSLVDGANVFGVSLTTLQPEKKVWAFGLTIIFFKLFVISLVVRLFQTSLHLKPADISPEWDAALARQT